jgi:hypothetical protein
MRDSPYFEDAILVLSAGFGKWKIVAVIAGDESNRFTVDGLRLTVRTEGIVRLKFQIPSTKFQINSKFKIRIPWRGLEI